MFISLLKTALWHRTRRYTKRCKRGIHFDLLPYALRYDSKIKLDRDGRPLPGRGQNILVPTSGASKRKSGALRLKRAATALCIRLVSTATGHSLLAVSPVTSNVPFHRKDQTKPRTEEPLPRQGLTDNARDARCMPPGSALPGSVTSAAAREAAATACRIQR